MLGVEVVLSDIIFVYQSKLVSLVSYKSVSKEKLCHRFVLIERSVLSKKDISDSCTANSIIS